VKLAINGLYGFAMTQLWIPKVKPKEWVDGIDIMTYTLLSKLRY
jgi:hypothetical protein